MKNKIYVLGMLMLAFTNVKADSYKKDSIIVTFGDKTRIIIYGENRKELDKILKYDLNALLTDLKVRLDSTGTGSDTTYLKEEVDGNTYLKSGSEKNEKDYVRIGLRGIHVKDGDTQVIINAQGVEVKEDEAEVSTDSSYRRIGKRFYKSSRNSSPRKGFNVAIGLNTYGQNNAGQFYEKSDYDLRPFGSRFVSLGYIASTTIARGGNSKFHLDFGIDFSWYNLMFDGNNTIEKNDERVQFELVRDDSGKEVNMKRSKLVVPYVNLSLMPTLSFSGSFVSYISAGIYGGYRLGSYTKLRAEGSKDVDRVRTNFYLEDLRYGLAAEIGFRKFPDLFVSYDMNNLYAAEKGPGVRMLSFGVRLF